MKLYIFYFNGEDYRDDGLRQWHEKYTLCFQEASLEGNTENVLNKIIQMDKDGCFKALTEPVFSINDWDSDYCIVVPNFLLTEVAAYERWINAEDILKLREEVLFANTLYRVESHKRLDSKLSFECKTSPFSAYSSFFYSESSRSASIELIEGGSSWSVQRQEIKPAKHLDVHYYKNKFRKIRERITNSKSLDKVVELGCYIKYEEDHIKRAPSTKSTLLLPAHIDANINAITNQEMPDYHSTLNLERCYNGYTELFDLLVSEVNNTGIERFAIIGKTNVNRPYCGLHRIGRINTNHSAIYLWNELHTMQVNAQAEMLTLPEEDMISYSKVFRRIMIPKLPESSENLDLLNKRHLMQLFNFLVFKVIDQANIDRGQEVILNQLAKIAKYLLRRDRSCLYSLERKINLLLSADGRLKNGKFLIVYTDDTKSCCDSFYKIIRDNAKYILGKVAHDYVQLVNMDETDIDYLLSLTEGAAVCLAPFEIIKNSNNGHKVKEMAKVIEKVTLLLSAETTIMPLELQKLLLLGKQIEVVKIAGNDSFVKMCRNAYKAKNNIYSIYEQLLVLIANLKANDFLKSDVLLNSEGMLFDKLRPYLLAKASSLSMEYVDSGNITKPPSRSNLYHRELDTLNKMLLSNGYKQAPTWREFQAWRGRKASGNDLKRYLGNHYTTIIERESSLKALNHFIKIKNIQGKKLEDQGRIRIKALLKALNEEMQTPLIMKELELKSRHYFMKEYLQPAVESGYVKMRYPKNPKHPKQAYSRTSKGLQLISQNDQR